MKFQKDEHHQFTDDPYERWVGKVLHALFEQGEYIVTALDDLTAKVTALEAASAAEKAEVALVLAALTAANTANDPALTALGARLQAVIDGTVATTTAEAAALPPTPAPAPTP